MSAVSLDGAPCTVSPESRMDELHRAAQACAELIRAWHQLYGVRMHPTHMSDADHDHYLAAVASTEAMDLSDPGAQREIAYLQVSGPFEWFFGEPIPEDLVRRVAAEYELVDIAFPPTIGEAGRWLRRVAEGREGPPEPEKAEAADPARRPVHSQTRDELRAAADGFYREILKEDFDEVAKVGGVNALLSMSLERNTWKGRPESDATLLSPQIMGLRVLPPGARPDALIDAIRAGEVVVKDMVGEPRE